MPLYTRGWGALLGLWLLLLALAGCGEGKQLPSVLTVNNVQQSVQDVGRYVDHVEVFQSSPDVFDICIVHKRPPLSDDAKILFMAADDYYKTCEALVKKWPNQFDNITFKMMLPLVDIYGNKSTGLALSLKFSMLDLRKVNWINFDGTFLLNLASFSQVTHIGRQLISAYCAGEWGSSSNLFCFKAAAWGG